MSTVAVQKVAAGDLHSPPVIEQIQNRLEDVRRRAFELFESRGCEPGHELEDWVAAERELLGWPPLETQEDYQEYAFEVALPGVHPMDVEVVATPREIVVHAQTQAEKKAKGAGAKWKGFASTHIYRRIVVPQAIQTAGIQATFDNGILCIRVSKAAQSASAS
ncbi:MAG: Hsp20 family protein [Bryobacteraceae bacterium]